MYWTVWILTLTSFIWYNRIAIFDVSTKRSDSFSFNFNVNFINSINLPNGTNQIRQWGPGQIVVVDAISVYSWGFDKPLRCISYLEQEVVVHSRALHHATDATLESSSVASDCSAAVALHQRPAIHLSNTTIIQCLRKMTFEFMDSNWNVPGPPKLRLNELIHLALE